MAVNPSSRFTATFFYLYQKKMVKDIKFFEAVRRAELMQTSTRWEDEMCLFLRIRGYSYIRQYPIRTPKKIYFADIYLPEYRCIIEMDGAYHFTEEQKRLDKNRSANIRRLGYRVIRFANKELKNKGKIDQKLKRLLKKL